jgi:hypothetical protein
MPASTNTEENTLNEEKTDKSSRATSAQESRLQDLLAELEGKSETAQRPIVDEIV